jgi:hypothetical protein
MSETGGGDVAAQLRYYGGRSSARQAGFGKGVPKEQMPYSFFFESTSSLHLFFNPSLINFFK